jgi:hypothetical protein
MRFDLNAVTGKIDERPIGLVGLVAERAQGLLLAARDILARLQAAGSVRILILDACRDNPIPQRLAKGRSTFVPRGLRPEPNR